MGNLVLKPFGIPPAREAGHDPYSEEELRQIVQREPRGRGDPGGRARLHRQRPHLRRPARARGDDPAPQRPVRHHGRRASTTWWIASAPPGSPACRCASPTAAWTRPSASCTPRTCSSPSATATATWRELARPLVRVPESMLIDELLEVLRRQRGHMALVVDEHGTAIGLITLEDVLEEIVGEIADEFDPEDVEPITSRDDVTLPIAGWAPIRLVGERLRLELPDAHEATIGGVHPRAARPPAGAGRGRHHRGACASRWCEAANAQHRRAQGPRRRQRARPDERFPPTTAESPS